jgi:hypothetical protein
VSVWRRVRFQEKKGWTRTYGNRYLNLQQVQEHFQRVRWRYVRALEKELVTGIHGNDGKN